MLARLAMLLPATDGNTFLDSRGWIPQRQSPCEILESCKELARAAASWGWCAESDGWSVHCSILPRHVEVHGEGVS